VFTVNIVQETIKLRNKGISNNLQYIPVWYSQEEIIRNQKSDLLEIKDSASCSTIIKLQNAETEEAEKQYFKVLKEKGLV
jgi:hypothetical protein